MSLNSFTSNQGTQTPILTDNTGGTAGTVIAVQKVDISPQGTAGTLWNGGVTGTINSGSITVTNGTIASDTIIGGTLNAGTFTLNGGTVGTVQSVNTIGTLPNVPGGTLNNIGTVLGIGTLSNLGSVTNIGTIPNTPGGTLNSVGSVIGAGTVSNIGQVNNAGTIQNGTLQQVNNIGTLPNLPQGSINVTTGTINTGTINTGTFVNNGGTVAVVQNAGTLQGGTINVGTFRGDGRTTQNIISYGTNIANSGAAAATVVGSASVGVGTSLWLSDLSVINPAGTTVCILGFGTAQQGTNVLFRGVLGTQTTPGIEKSYAKAVNAGMTNQDLVFSTTGAGTIDLSISYFISA